MSFWKKLFNIKKIIKVEFVEHIDGLDEDEKLANLVVGDMEGGFEGAVVADVYNQYHSAKTVFRVYYEEGTIALEEVEDYSSRYNFLVKLLKVNR